ncbi:MAG: mechanosensitive ion channel family protein [Chloroflexi bacterium]|nr:mechanosensitive ion channel family protein [Chloroflexota bacterium]
MLASWHEQTFLGIEVQQYIGIGVLLGIVVLWQLLLTRGLGIVLRRRIADAGKREFWDRERRRLSLPILWLGVAAVVLAGFPVLDFPADVEDVVSRVGSLIGAAALVLLGFRGVDIFTAVLRKRAAQTDTKMDDQLVPIIRTSLRVGVLALGGLFVLSNLGVNVAALFAGVGLLGLGVALAAQDTVKNFFGGVTVFADKPFQIGDWIVVGGVEGTVEEVGLRSTRVRTFYNSIVTVPNYTFTDTNVDNMGARRWRRYSTTLGLSYSTTPEQMQAFVEGLRAIIRANPSMRTDFYIVEFKEFGPSTLDVMLYCFIDAPNWNDEMRVRHVLNLDIVRLAERLRVEFAFPTQTLHLDSGPGQRFQAPAPPEPDQLAGAVNDFGPNGAAGQRTDRPLTSGFDNG